MNFKMEVWKFEHSKQKNALAKKSFLRFFKKKLKTKTKNLPFYFFAESAFQFALQEHWRGTLEEELNWKAYHARTVCKHCN